MMRRLAFTSFVCGVLYVVAAAVALVSGSGHSPAAANAAAAVVEFGAPAIAGVVLLLLSVSFPDLLEPFRLTFPMNVTSPPLFCGLTYAVVTLISGPQASIQRTPDVLLPALVWLDWRLLAMTCVGQMGIMTLAVVVRRRFDLMQAGRQ